MTKATSSLDQLDSIALALQEVDVKFHPRTLRVLVALAKQPNQPMTQVGLAETLREHVVYVHRSIMALCDKHNGQEGYGFVRLDDNPESYREKLITLTPKGMAFVNRLSQLLNAG